jgi:exodeoxyribonuclease VII small subunit
MTHDINNLSYEAAFAQLEDILNQLESGNLALEDLLSLYERGRALRARCEALLDSAELRVQKLNDDGTLSLG